MMRRFREGAYHSGNVWLFQTFEIAEGLRKRGYWALGQNLDNRVTHVVQYLKYYPEFVRGSLQDKIEVSEAMVVVRDRDGSENTAQQSPQEVQGWTLTAYLAIIFREEHGHSMPKNYKFKTYEREVLHPI